MKVFCAAVAVVLISMGHPVAAQNSCPTRADLRQGMTLIAHNYLANRVVAETDFGIVERRVDANGQYRNVEGIPDFLMVGSPHDVMPGLFRIGKDYRTITYDLDGLGRDIGFASPGAHPIDMMDVGEKMTFSVSIDAGSWQMLGLVIWKAFEGTVEVEYTGTPIESSHMLGPCEYDFVTYHVTTKMEDQYPSHKAVYFAPALGLVIGYTTLSEEGHPLHTFWFQNIRRSPFWSSPVDRSGQ